MQLVANARRSVRQAYRPDSVCQREPADRQSFLWTDHCWPVLATYPHTKTSRLSAKKPAYAYLVLLRVEVTAFHPTALCTEMQENTEVAVSVPACASPCCGLVSVALVLGLSDVMPALPDGC